MRALFVLILLASVPLWYVRYLLKQKAIVEERMREQKKVLRHFEKYGPRADFRSGFVVDLGFACNPYVAGLGWKGAVGPCDAELVHLPRFENLEILSLGSSNVTDGGLSHVGELTNLKVLSLDHTRISDAGLKHLFNLNQLRFVNIGRTNVTDDGVARLRKALPNCEIRR